MFKEEKIINGVLSWRTEPEGGWTPYTIQELSAMCEKLKSDSAKAIEWIKRSSTSVAESKRLVSQLFG